MGHPGINLMIAQLAVVNLAIVCLMIINLMTIDSAGRASRISGRLRAAIADVATGMAGG
jgi:hypothetical protein